MAWKKIDDNKLSAIGNAIREKGGTTELLTLDAMPTAITNLPSGGGSGGGEELTAIVEGSLVELNNNEATKIADNIFRGSTIETVNCPNATYVGLGSFAYTNNLKNINLPKLQSTGMEPFIGNGQWVNTDFTSIDFPECTMIGVDCFNGRAMLKDVNLPKLVELGSSAFANCVALEEIILPECTYCNGSWAFDGCTNLKRVDLPKYNDKFYARWFSYCPNLEAVILRADTVVKLNNLDNFEASSVAAGTGYVYVPASRLEEYKTATNWTVYANQIRAIEDYPDICG